MTDAGEHLNNTTSMSHTLLTSVKPTIWQMQVNTWITPLCHTLLTSMKPNKGFTSTFYFLYFLTFLLWHMYSDSVTGCILTETIWLIGAGDCSITIVLSLERKKKSRGWGGGWVDKQTPQNSQSKRTTTWTKIHIDKKCIIRVCEKPGTYSQYYLLHTTNCLKLFHTHQIFLIYSILANYFSLFSPH